MTTGEQREPQQRLRLMREIGIQADALAGQAEELGKQAGESLRTRRSQLTGLEAIADSTLKLTDVWDYVKVRTARSEANKDWRANDFGVRLLRCLREELANRARMIATAEHLPEEGQRQAQLLLTRQFIRQVVAHYEFSCIRDKEPARERR